MNKSLIAGFAALIYAGTVLVGCSGQKASEEPKKAATAAEQKEVSNKPVSKPQKDESGNIILTEVGQKASDDDGTTAELMKIKEVNQTVDIAPVKLTVQDLKVIKLTNVGKDFGDFLLQYTGGSELPKELNYIQVNYTAENTEDKNISWNQVQTLVTNTGEQLDASGNDFIWEKNPFDGTFYGKTKIEGTIGVITNSKPEDLTSLKFIISSTFDPDTFEDITPEQQAVFQF
ncbi:hypothetical protein [Neobacillus sp. Marseille-QA0830]